MIRLSKLPKPQLLVDNEAEWTQTLLDYYTRGDTPPGSLAKKYREPDIKAVLVQETHDKCVYCEAKISHSQHGDVEHIKPKSKFREQTYSWENLTLVCAVCNGKKSDYYDLARPILNPYIDDPEQHFDTEGSLVFGLDSSISGKTTELKLDLNRNDLVLRRGERLKGLMSLVQRYESESDPNKRAVLQDELKYECEKKKEYSFVVEKMLRRRGIL